MVTMKNSKKLHTNLNKCQVGNCPDFPGRNLISRCNRRVTSAPAVGLKFHPGKPGSYNHHPRKVEVIILTLFWRNIPFLYSLKTSENLWFFNVFRGYRN